jgi:hypothetical protein
VRANPNDRVVVDEVPIGGRVGPSIRSVVADFSDDCLKHGCQAFESGAQDHRRAPLFLLLSQVLKIVDMCRFFIQIIVILNMTCMPVRNFSSYIHGAMSSQG